VRLTEDRELRRSRVGVLLRPLLAIPAVVVASLWTAVALVLLPFAWIGALAGGRVPGRLHRTFVAALESIVQLLAWTSLVSGRYPLPWRRERHPARLESACVRQPRWTVLLRVPLGVPAVVLASVLAVVLAGSAVGAWFVALILGRTTEGLRELGAFCLRYVTETAAYLLLLSPRYPRLAQPLAAPQAAQ
jgi:hypothetical protein